MTLLLPRCLVRAGMPDGNYTGRASRARVLIPAGATSTRLIGFIGADD